MTNTITQKQLGLIHHYLCVGYISPLEAEGYESISSREASEIIALGGLRCDVSVCWKPLAKKWLMYRSSTKEFIEVPKDIMHYAKISGKAMNENN